jgi:ABC-2 type transport system ATP-binding protein
MDEAEHCHRLGFIQNGQMVALGSPEEIKETMAGQVLEIDCTAPKEALESLRRLEGAGEVSLYGSLIHVITPDPSAMRPRIEAKLRGAGIEIHTIERIAPSLEDVFIASVQSQSEDRLHG